MAREVTEDFNQRAHRIVEEATARQEEGYALAMERVVGNVKLVARSLSIEGQPDEESDYIVNAYQINGHLSSPPIRLSKPGGAEAALDEAVRDPWVVAHAGT